MKDRTEHFVIDTEHVLAPDRQADVRRIETARAVSRPHQRTMVLERERDEDLEISP